jgi:hypothetical protein
MSIPTVELKRVNMQLPKWQIDKVDEYAGNMNLSRTGVISLILAEYFKQQETINGLSALSKMADDQKK